MSFSSHSVPEKLDNIFFAFAENCATEYYLLAGPQQWISSERKEIVCLMNRVNDSCSRKLFIFCSQKHAKKLF